MISILSFYEQANETILNRYFDKSFAARSFLYYKNFYWEKFSERHSEDLRIACTAWYDVKGGTVAKLHDGSAISTINSAFFGNRKLTNSLTYLMTMTNKHYSFLRSTMKQDKL